MRLDLILPFAELVAGTRSSADYCRNNGVDFAETVAACGGVHVAAVKPNGPLFEACEGGILAAWCEVRSEAEGCPIDAVAWPLDRPEHWWTLGGMAAVLGEPMARNPSTYALDGALRLHRRPLD